MAYQKVFRRVELKYMLDSGQKERIVRAMKPYMELDKYGRTTIRNIYFDTDNYRLIRRSIEKPEYKEKLRVRSYSRATSDSRVFVELKKKYKKVVYKRRISLGEQDAMRWLTCGEECVKHGQIPNEINYFLSCYGNLSPKAFISYEREAYFDKAGTDFRVTFDDNALARFERISLTEDVGGEPLLPDGKLLMEIKCSGGIPLWMVRVLSQEEIYKTSFSKYGTAYVNLILPNLDKQTNEWIKEDTKTDINNYCCNAQNTEVLNNA